MCGNGEVVPAERKELKAYTYVNVCPPWPIQVSDLEDGKIECLETRPSASGGVLRKVSFWLPESWLRLVEDERSEND